MSAKKTVKEQIRELEEEYADEIKRAQSQPGLREMEIVYGRGSRQQDTTAASAPATDC